MDKDVTTGSFGELDEWPKRGSLAGELPQSQKDKLPVYTREDMARCWDECEKAWGDFRRADWAYNKMTFKHNQPQPPANPYREIKKETL